VSGKSWTFTDTQVSTGTKEVSNGTYFATAVPAVALYDDFSAPLVDPDKWFGAERSGGGGILAEAVRLIQANGLRLSSRSYGATDSDVERGHGSFQLVFPDANSIHAIRAKVQVVNVQSVGCAANASPTQAAAVIGGFFFNSGTPTPGDSTGDVIVGINVARLSDSTDGPQVLEIFGSAVQCTNADCSAQTSLPGAPVPLGKIAVGVPVRLFIAWDKSKKRFLFQRGINAMVALPYVVSDNAPPSNALKGLGLVELVAACTSAPRPAAMVNALFDHVEVGTQ